MRRASVKGAKKRTRSEVLGPCDDAGPSPRLQLEIREYRQIRLTRAGVSRVARHVSRGDDQTLPACTVEKMPWRKVRALCCYLQPGQAMTKYEKAKNTVLLVIKFYIEFQVYSLIIFFFHRLEKRYCKTGIRCRI